MKNITWKRYGINKQDIPKKKNYIERMLTNNSELFSLNQNVMDMLQHRKIRNLNIIIIGFFMFLVLFYLLLNLFYFI